MVGNLSRHMKTCHVPEGIKCDYCCCTFLMNRSRFRHQFAVHGVRIRNRSTTNFKKTIIARAKKTLKSGVISSQLKNGKGMCSVCGKDFVNRHRLMEHMNSHTGARPFRCETCGYKFTHRSNLYRHRRTAHPSNNKVVCQICKCNFSSHQMLVRHNTTMHPKKLKIKKLNSPNGKVSELISDRNNEPARRILPAKKILPAEMPSLKLECPSQNSLGSYSCHVCQKELSTPQTWRGHMLIHQNLKPYKCKHCGISFRLAGTRHQHVINSHTGGTFKCKNCTCRFKSKRALDRHAKSICKNKKVKKLPQVKTDVVKKENTECEQKTENVAGFKCNLCGTVVRMLKDFEVHKTLHTTTDRSKCNLCLKQFQSAVNAKIHKKRAHGDATVHIYGCAFCCCRYTSSQALYSHLVKEHEMNKEDWDSEAKSIRIEARRRIQYKLCAFDPKQEVSESKAEKVKTATFERKDRNIDRKATTSTQILKAGRHECDICHLKFKVATSISKHKKEAHNHGAYSCGICPCRYHKITWLKKHQLRVHGYVKLPVRKLEQPKEIFARKNLTKSLISSKERLRNDSAIECNICKLKFKSSGSLAMHKKKSHFHSGKFKCTQCSCKFKVLRGLKVHLNLHHGYVGVKRQKLIQKLSASESIFDEEDEDSTLDTSTNKNIETNGNELVDEGSQRSHNDILKSEKKFECDLCNMKFSHRSTIGNHKKKSHFHSGKFKCSKCTCKFLSVGGLLNHKKYHHGFVGKGVLKMLTEIEKNVESKISKSPTKLTSQKEDANSKRKDKVNLNRQTLSGRGKVECTLCNLMVSRGKIATHITTSHGSGSFSCPDCTCVFTKPLGVVRHRIVYHGFRRKNRDEDKSIQQERAGSKSNSKVNLNFLKIRSSSSPKRNLSKISTSPVKNPPVQKRETDNVAMHPSKPPRPASAATNYKYKCDQCGIKFTHTAYLRRHKTKAHAEGGFSCSLCSCTFISAGALAAHKRIYHSLTAKDGPSTLKRTKKSVQNKLTIKKRLPSAIVKRAKRSVNNNQLASTLKKASSIEALTEKQSTTDIRTRHKTRLEDSTSSENTSRNNLGESVSENSNTIEPFVKQKHQCTWCLKAFHSPKLLEKHILSHTRPEICQQCGMRFRTAVEVSAHVKTAHDKRSLYECPICSCRFTTSFGLASHHTKIHKKQSVSYDNIVIEHDEGVAVDNEPFIESVYPNQNIQDDLCDDSEPIIQGILETNYSPNVADEEYDNEANFQENLGGGGATREFQEEDEVEVYEDSVPIIQGVLEYDNSEVEYPTSTPSTNTAETKKSFSPKSRPIKCCTCGVTCYGPENLRLHMQSHQQDIENEEENVQVDNDDNDGNFLRKCDRCTYEFKTSHDLSQHMQLEHDESGLYRCAYCPCTMKNETNLRYHFLRYHSG